MQATDRPLIVNLQLPTDDLQVDERYPFEVSIHRPLSSESPVTILNLHSRTPQLVLDLDLFQRDLVLYPGESYRLLVYVLFTQPGRYNRQALWVQFRELSAEKSDHLYFEEGFLDVRPSPANEIKVEVEPICSYEAGTKVRLQLEHCGGTPFEDFRAELEPGEVVFAARSIRRDQFAPGDKEQFEAVLRPGCIHVVFKSSTLGRNIESRKEVVVEPVKALLDRPKFTFLEPRQLAGDHITVYQSDDKNSKPISLHHGAYPVRGQEKYRIEIHPRHSNVKSVQFHEIKDRIHCVGDPQYDPDTNTCTILVEVVVDKLMSQRERVYYDVMTSSGESRGEIHFFIQPSWKRFAIFSLTAGAAVTVQGFIGIVRLFATGSLSVERLITSAVFDWEIGWNLLMLLSIPIILLALPVVDWLVEGLTLDE